MAPEDNPRERTLQFECRYTATNSDNSESAIVSTRPVAGPRRSARLMKLERQRSGQQTEQMDVGARHCYRDDPGNPDLRLQFLSTRARTPAPKLPVPSGARELLKFDALAAQPLRRHL